MKIIDLTHVIDSDMPVYPGTEKPIIQRANTLEKDGFVEAKITMYSHTGTHIDAPAHMLDNGLTLDKLEIDHFIGNCVILDFSKVNIKSIDVEALKQYEDKIKNVEFVIVKTGWSKYWGSNKYYKDFSYLSKEAAEWLTNFNLKGIGTDAISIDSIDTSTFDAHKVLMSADVLIIENLTNLDMVNNEFFVLSVMPMKFKNADGSPVRAIAIENIQKNLP